MLTKRIEAKGKLEKNLGHDLSDLKCRMGMAADLTSIT